MAALLLRRRRPIGEPAALADLVGSPGIATLEGTAGAGRVCMALAELHVDLDRLEQAVFDADRPDLGLGALDLGRRFDTVILGSHFVNLPQQERRRALLGVAVRHAAAGGRVLVEHHPIDWAETAEATSATPGADVGMEDVRRDPPFVSAVSTFDIGGRWIRQPFTARVLSESELASELASAGLKLERRLSRTWLEASAAR